MVFTRAEFAYVSIGRVNCPAGTWQSSPDIFVALWRLLIA